MFRFISQFRYGKISQTCIPIETCITIVNAFKTFQAVQKENQKKKKYGSIKAVNFITVLLKNGSIYKSIQHTMKENLLFLKDLLQNFEKQDF